MKTIKLMRPIVILATYLLIVSTAFISCKKTTPATPITVTSCFDSNNNGTYIGNGTASGVPFTNSGITITKLSCTSLKIESTKFSTITVNSLTASAGGGYTGTTTYGNSISINFSGNNTSSISCPELNFSGTK